MKSPPAKSGNATEGNAGCVESWNDREDALPDDCLSPLSSGDKGLVLYGLTPLSTPQILLEAPLGLQELALALWLILKGFTAPRGVTGAAHDVVGEGQHRPVPHAAA